MDTSHLHRKRRRPPQRPLPLLGYLFFSLALPEVVLHIATATSPQSIFNSGLFLGFGFNAVTVLVLFALIGFFGAPKFFSITSSVIALLFCSFQLFLYRVFHCKRWASCPVLAYCPFPFSQSTAPHSYHGTSPALLQLLGKQAFDLSGRKKVDAYSSCRSCLRSAKSFDRNVTPLGRYRRCQSLWSVPPQFRCLLQHP